MRDLNADQLQANLQAFRAGLSPDARYASFDYCYNYFQDFRERGPLKTLACEEHLQVSALHLGFYLASWGMYRGSTELLQRSVRHLSPVIAFIANTPKSIWDIDVDHYTPTAIDELLNLNETLKEALKGNATDTLLTKIMLGVFGNVPAFDTQFKAGFGTSSLGKKALEAVGAFAREHHEFLSSQRIHTHDFLTGAHTNRPYPKAKLLDMIFFIEGSRGQSGQSSK
ncbi:hypothetical protein [Deinococcus humi]|uniref:Uncharacterized protein n=1 Tax=Deinococcus humi TaxID=662880 RepID=A0A7W8JYV6_9DEIO|nr:hypothetical protein [Deinococcus humi]MBB5365742.1 hypothetical protein [Deinococcus humi]GGO38387.1 hypothetical protein GCM10008949_44820 [Deinococcus humi]